jgi:uncharacterized protein YcbK (DUF882 family)
MRWLLDFISSLFSATKPNLQKALDRLPDDHFGDVESYEAIQPLESDMSKEANLTYFTVREYLKGRVQLIDLSKELQDNMFNILMAADVVRRRYGKPLIVSSGYRSPEFNASIGGAKNSAHMSCEAIDLVDIDGKLKDWIAANVNILEELDLYMEHPSATPTWCHLQTRPTRSGNRIFRP